MDGSRISYPYLFDRLIQAWQRQPLLTKHQNQTDQRVPMYESKTKVSLSKTLAKLRRIHMKEVESHLKGFLSIYVISFTCCRNEVGLSATTCIARIRVYLLDVRQSDRSQKLCPFPSPPTLRYSIKRRRKATKCSALLMFPGTASFKMSSGRTAKEYFSDSCENVFGW